MKAEDGIVLKLASDPPRFIFVLFYRLFRNMAFTTKKSLLARVRAGDNVSWNEFYATYRPLIFLCGRDCGLTHDENEELVQLVMCEIFQKDILGKYNPDEVPPDVTFHYDPSRGRFRHYFKAIVRNQALKLYRKRKDILDIDSLPEIADEARFDSVWDEEWRRHLFTQALDELRNQVQPITFSAFEMYAIQEHPVKKVADFLQLSVNSVYVAKNRCIAALKKIIEKLDHDRR